jgi:hypothetical protein
MAPTPKGIVPIPPAGTLTLEQSAQLMNDPEFRGRVKVALLNLAMQTLREANQNLSRLRWAQSTITSADTSVVQAIGPVVMQPGVQEKGTEIDDGTLMFATGNALNSII